MAEQFFTINKARKHKYQGNKQPHLSVRKSSPEDLHITITLPGAYAVTLALEAHEAHIVGQMLIDTAKQLKVRANDQT